MINKFYKGPNLVGPPVVGPAPIEEYSISSSIDVPPSGDVDLLPPKASSNVKSSNVNKIKSDVDEVVRMYDSLLGDALKEYDNMKNTLLNPEAWNTFNSSLYTSFPPGVKKISSLSSEEISEIKRSFKNPELVDELIDLETRSEIMCEWIQNSICIQANYVFLFNKYFLQLSELQFEELQIKGISKGGKRKQKVQKGGNPILIMLLIQMLILGSIINVDSAWFDKSSFPSISSPSPYPSSFPSPVPTSAPTSSNIFDQGPQIDDDENEDEDKDEYQDEDELEKIYSASKKGKSSETPPLLRTLFNIIRPVQNEVFINFAGVTSTAESIDPDISNEVKLQLEQLRIRDIEEKEKAEAQVKAKAEEEEAKQQAYKMERWSLLTGQLKTSPLYDEIFSNGDFTKKLEDFFAGDNNEKMFHNLPELKKLLVAKMASREGPIWLQTLSENDRKSISSTIMSALMNSIETTFTTKIPATDSYIEILKNAISNINSDSQKTGSMFESECINLHRGYDVLFQGTDTAFLIPLQQTGYIFTDRPKTFTLPAPKSRGLVPVSSSNSLTTGVMRGKTIETKIPLGEEALLKYSEKFDADIVIGNRCKDNLPKPIMKFDAVPTGRAVVDTEDNSKEWKITITTRFSTGNDLGDAINSFVNMKSRIDTVIASCEKEGEKTFNNYCLPLKSLSQKSDKFLETFSLQIMQISASITAKDKMGGYITIIRDLNKKLTDIAKQMENSFPIDMEKQREIDKFLDDQQKVLDEINKRTIAYKVMDKGSKIASAIGEGIVNITSATSDKVSDVYNRLDESRYNSMEQIIRITDKLLDPYAIGGLAFLLFILPALKPIVEGLSTFIAGFIPAPPRGSFVAIAAPPRGSEYPALPPPPADVDGDDSDDDNLAVVNRPVNPRNNDSNFGGRKRSNYMKSRKHINKTKKNKKNKKQVKQTRKKQKRHTRKRRRM